MSGAYQDLKQARNHEEAEATEVLAQLEGKSLMRAEATAPTHPHPGAAGSTAAQWTVGPFASMLDRVKDSLGK